MSGKHRIPEATDHSGRWLLLGLLALGTMLWAPFVVIATGMTWLMLFMLAHMSVFGVAFYRSLSM